MDNYANMSFFVPTPRRIRKSGYTMVELVMVIGIMAIMFSVGAASYRDYQRRQYLESAVLMVVDDIKLARQLALSGRLPAGCANFNGYAIRVSPATNTYSIGAVCGNQNCENNSGTDYCVKENVPIPQGISISSISGFPSSMVTFLSQGRGIGRGVNDPDPTDNDAEITLSYSGGAVLDRTITILSSGGIETD
jgi:prepilin-type N-terminal cleavage/methylation domain-containing protein